jgi:hypothetical protein
MHTVKPSKKWNLPSWQKRRFLSNKKKRLAYLSTIVFASWLGTYLDMYFVGKGLYAFPVRPFPAIFMINIAFTLIGLPVFITVFLYLMESFRLWGKGVWLIIMSLGMMFMEKQAEAIGWFVHHEQWKHLYSFFGYFLFMMIVWKFYRWQRGENRD